MRDWIDNHYLDRILSILSKEVKSVIIDVASIDLKKRKKPHNKNKNRCFTKSIGVIIDHNSVRAP